MKPVTVISTCIKINREGAYYFHFKGHYLGTKITSLVIYSNLVLEVNEEYVMEIENINLRGSELFCYCKKARRVF